MERLCITHLHSGGLITNYYCSSACRHCLYRCSPRWPKDYLDKPTAFRYLEIIRQRGCNSIHIGGGEPMLRPDLLAEVLGATRSCGVTVEYVETNSSWFQSLETAVQTLEKLAACGLRTLLVSISPFHNEFIPFSKVKGVVQACRETGISVFPWMQELAADLVALDDQTRHSLREYEELFGEDYLSGLLRRYRVTPGGRALELFRETYPRRSVAEWAAGGGCRELAGTFHFHIDLYGNYVPGLCAGFAIECGDLGAPLAPEKYPLLTRLYAGGIGAALEYAAKEFGFRPARETYAAKCELCFELRRFIVVECGAELSELRPVGHYLYG